MAIVRISLGRFDTNQYETICKLLQDSQNTLVPAIRGLKGNRAYYVGIDRENSSMTNVSVWDTLADAQQMASLQAMLDLAARSSSQRACDSSVRSQTTKRFGPCSLDRRTPAETAHVAAQRDGAESRHTDNRLPRLLSA